MQLRASHSRWRPRRRFRTRSGYSWTTKRPTLGPRTLFSSARPGQGRPSAAKQFRGAGHIEEQVPADQLQQAIAAKRKRVSAPVPIAARQDLGGDPREEPEGISGRPPLLPRPIPQPPGFSENRQNLAESYFLSASCAKRRRPGLGSCSEIQARVAGSSGTT